MSNASQSAEFKSDLAVQDRPKKRGDFRHYCAVATIAVGLVATLAWTAFLSWAELRIVGIL
jgi:hypothetical protein